MKLAAIRFLYRCRRLAFGALRLKTQGVKVMVFNPDGELLLVRNTYGRSRLYVLPGGGVGRSEALAETAAREVWEETGVSVEGTTFVSTHRSEAEGKRDTIHLFTAISSDAPEPDCLEIEEACFFPLSALPDDVSAATQRRIAEYRGEKPVEDRW